LGAVAFTAIAFAASDIMDRRARIPASGPARDENGKLAITQPVAEAKLPSIAASDIGACAYGIFKEGTP
jgi:hypothetical protein